MKISPEAPLCFVHLQKTAGTSLIAWLSGQIDENEFIQEVPGVSTVKEIQAEKGRFTAISGHFKGSIRRVLPPTTYYTTILRSPIERTISAFYHDQRNGRFLNSEHSNFQSISLSDAVKSPAFPHFYWNCQANTLSTFADEFTPPSAGEWDNITTETELRILSAAKKALQTFSCVGVTEFFDEYLELLTTQLDLPGTEPGPRLNTSPSGQIELSNYDPFTIQALEFLNRLDIQLYCFALQNQFSNFSAMSTEILSKKLVSVVTEENGFIMIPVKELKESLGWLRQGPEEKSENYRWSDKRMECSIHFLCDPFFNWKLSLLVHFPDPLHVLAACYCTLNGRKITRVSLTDNGRIVVSLDRDCLAPQGVANVFALSKLPPELSISSDRVSTDEKRPLGYNISSIILKPQR